MLHKNEKTGFFVYAGYVFTNRKELESAKCKYRDANKQLKKALKRQDELKASTLKNKYS